MLALPVDVVDGVSHRADRLHVIVCDFDVERVLEEADQGDHVERLRAKLLDERRLGRDALFGDTELVSG